MCIRVAHNFSKMGKEIHDFFKKRLLTGTLPVNNSLLTGTVLVNNSLLTGIVRVINSLLTVTRQVNNLMERSCFSKSCIKSLACHSVLMSCVCHFSGNLIG